LILYWLLRCESDQSPLRLDFEWVDMVDQTLNLLWIFPPAVVLRKISPWVSQETKEKLQAKSQNSFLVLLQILYTQLWRLVSTIMMIASHFVRPGCMEICFLTVQSGDESFNQNRLEECMATATRCPPTAPNATSPATDPIPKTLGKSPWRQCPLYCDLMVAGSVMSEIPIQWYKVTDLTFFRPMTMLIVKDNLRAEEAVLLRIPHILSIGLRWLGSAHLLSKCVSSAGENPLKLSDLTLLFY